MAAIDYGVLVKINGVLRETEGNMRKSVGYTLEYAKNPDVKIKDNFSAYIGDREFTVCISKRGNLCILKGSCIIYQVYWGFYLGMDDWYHGKKYARELKVDDVIIRIRRLYDQNRYKLRFWYKGSLYECLYGYGVDSDVNLWYYRG